MSNLNAAILDWLRWLAVEETLVEGAWLDAPYWYRPTGAYTALQFPIRKGDLPKPWLVIDELHWPDGRVQIRAHKDEDQVDRILPREAWRIWPNARKLADWHNEPFRRRTRLASVRMRSYTPTSLSLIENHWLAKEALELQADIENDPLSAHATLAGRLDWSPSGQVWLDGRRWVVITPRGGVDAANL